MGIKDIVRKFLNKNERFKELENEDRFVNKIEQKKLSANERELNRFREEQRQENIKRELEEFRKNKHNEIWHGPSALDTPNMFKGEDNQLLKSENIFRKHTSLKGDNIFFK